MAKFDGIDPWKLVYRRVQKRDFQAERLEEGIWEPNPGAFLPSKVNSGLSVFVLDRTTPFRVLQHHLDTWTKILQEGSDEDKLRAQRILDRDKSVGHMITERGWRVIAVPMLCFPSRDFKKDNFSLDPLDCGHFSYYGSEDAFERAALRICENPNHDVLSIDECLDISRVPLRETNK